MAVRISSAAMEVKVVMARLLPNAQPMRAVAGDRLLALKMDPLKARAVLKAL